MQINGREIGYGNPTFIVAELSCNHCGSLDLAKRLIREAKDAGADAVKFQVYSPDELTVNSEHPAYMLKSGPWAGRRLYDLYAEAQTPREWMPELFAYAEEVGITAFASVFSIDGVAYLESLGCPAYKIASAEVTDLELVRAVALTGKPVILSDGLATQDQLSAAVYVYAKQTGNHSCSNLAVLRCVSEYPAPPESYGLGDYYHDVGEWEPLFGISDHTKTNDVAIAAVALGACVVEKHLMLPYNVYLSSDVGYPLDIEHSVQPRQFADYVQAIRRTEAMMQPSRPREATGEFRRRLVYARDLPEGHTVTRDDLMVKRCSEGPEPDAIVSGELLYDVKAGDPVEFTAGDGGDLLQ